MEMMDDGQSGWVVSCVWNKKLLVGVYLTSYFDFLDGTCVSLGYLLSADPQCLNV